MNEQMSFDEMNLLRRKCFFMYLSGGAVITFSILLAVFTMTMVFCILGILAGVIIIVIASKKKKEFNKYYKNTIVKRLLEQHFQNVDYRWEEGFSSQFVYSMNLISRGNVYHSEDYLRAKYKGINFSQADVTIEEETTDSEGNTSTTTYFKGRIIAIEYPKETSYVRLTSKKFHFAQGLRKRDYPEVDTENVSFNKAFKIVAESPVDAFYLLTPPMMEKLQYIISRYGNLGLCCYNHMLYMAINTKRNAFDTGVGINMDYNKEMTNLTEDISLIENLIDIIYSQSAN